MKRRTSKEEQHPQMKMFRKALPLQLALQEIVRRLGDVEGQRCLNVGDAAGVLACQLRKLGGSWATVVSTGTEADMVRGAVGDEVYTLQDDGRLPFEDKTFDVIVIFDFLETVEDDQAFVEECHRVLKTAGNLVVNVRHIKTWTLLRPLENLVGLSYEQLGLARPGYTEPEIFRILKNGFDVSNLHTYGRFFVRLVDLFVKVSVGDIDSAAALEKALRCYAVAGPFYRLAFQVDILLLMTRGYSMICRAKRRAWLPRKTPILADGRSISEAVLSRALG